MCPAPPSKHTSRKPHLKSLDARGKDLAVATWMFKKLSKWKIAKVMTTTFVVTYRY